jgi:hypothetical protein
MFAVSYFSIPEACRAIIVDIIKIKPERETYMADSDIVLLSIALYFYSSATWMLSVSRWIPVSCWKGRL